MVGASCRLDAVIPQRRFMLSGCGVIVDFRVVSLCHYLQGPAATQYLADMGADVVKVEPLHGAHERRWSGANTFINGVSGFFLCANRNKRSIAVDLKSDAGREILLRLVDTADAVVENFRPGVLDRLGLGYESLKERKPDIIYASATGFGADGPMKDKPGQDLLIQARSGLAAATGAGGSPTAVGCAAVDQHGGALLAMGVLGAYVRRLQTGEGTRIEASLLSAGIDLQAEPLTNYLSGGFDRSRFARDRHLATWFHEAPYGIYEVSDGHIALSMNDPQTLAETLDDDRLRAMAATDRYQERDAWAGAVADAVRTRTLGDLEARFDAAGIWWAPVQDYDDLARDAQVAHNRTFRQIDVNGSKATLVNHPLRYDGQVPDVHRIAFEVGQDGREILTELGYSQAEIEGLVEARAVALGD